MAPCNKIWLVIWVLLLLAPFGAASFTAVAVTGTTRVMNSADGITWTTAPVADSWIAVAYSPTLDRLVAVKTNGVITSDDAGESWTARTPGGAQAWRDVVWCDFLDLFIAVATTETDESQVQTSPDGITWTLRADLEGIQNWREVECSANIAVVVGTGTTMNSPDATTWTQRTIANSEWRGLAWAGELNLFAAVASSATGTQAATSPDGTTWTSRTLDAHRWQAVAWSPDAGVFVGVGDADLGTSTQVATSADGITWSVDANIAGGDWQDIAWSETDNLFAAVSAEGVKVATSPDGSAWTSRTPAEDNQWFGVIGVGIPTPPDPPTPPAAGGYFNQAVNATATGWGLPLSVVASLAGLGLVGGAIFAIARNSGGALIPVGVGIIMAIGLVTAMELFAEWALLLLFFGLVVFAAAQFFKQPGGGE